MAETSGEIQRLMQEIRETRAEIKVLNDGLKDLLEQNEDYQELLEETKELTQKRAEARKLLKADADYQKLSSEVDEVKFKLKDLQEILSHHLVTFYNETQETKFTDAEGTEHQVIIVAKLGKSY